MLNRLASILVVTFFISCVGTLCQAQQESALPIEDALQNRSFDDISSIDFSPDGKWLVYVVQVREVIDPLSDKIEGHHKDWRYIKDIWLLNTENGEATNLTKGKGNNWFPRWSPDGRLLAFVSDRDAGSRLWVWDVNNNALNKVSDLHLNVFQPLEWTPDSRSIFVTISGGPPLDAQVNAVRAFTDSQTTDGDITHSAVHVYQSIAAGQGDGEVSDSASMNADRLLRDLVKVDVVTGRVVAIIQNRRLLAYRISPDGSRVAYTIAAHFKNAGREQPLVDLLTLTMPTNQEKVLASGIWLVREFSWSPDGTLVSYQVGWEEKVHDCYVVAAEGGTPRNVTRLPGSQLSRPNQDVTLSTSAPLWDKSGNSIYFVNDGSLWRAFVGGDKASQIVRLPNRRLGNRSLLKYNSSLWTTEHENSTIVVARDDVGKQDGFYKINLTTGKSTQLLEEDQCYTCVGYYNQFAVRRDSDQIAYVAENAQHYPDLWLSDAGFGSSRRLTHLNPQFDKYILGSAQVIEWLGDDGEKLRGALLLPSDYQRGKRYPLIVWVYSGVLLSNDCDRFGFVNGGALNMQLLATRGYAVLFPDSPRNEGTQSIDLVKTVLPGVNKVVDMGIADPKRLGIMGHSAGGYSTMALIVQTKRFRAAIEMDGMADLVGFYGQMGSDGTAHGIGTEELRMAGTPWQLLGKYIEDSPFFFLDRVETPLLIVHGAEDTTVAPFLGDQIFVALRRLGKEVEYVKYETEGHFPQGYANQLDLWNRVIAWFDKHLKGSQLES